MAGWGGPCKRETSEFWSDKMAGWGGPCKWETSEFWSDKMAAFGGEGLVRGRHLNSGQIRWQPLVGRAL